MSRSKPLKSLLIESLKNPKEAAGYFNAVLEECNNCSDQEAQKMIMIALKNIADAQGGISKLSEKTGLGRESLYKTLSKKGNPKFYTLNALFKAMGMEIRVCPTAKR